MIPTPVLRRSDYTFGAAIMLEILQCFVELLVPALLVSSTLLAFTSMLWVAFGGR